MRFFFEPCFACLSEDVQLMMVLRVRRMTMRVFDWEVFRTEVAYTADEDEQADGDVGMIGMQPPADGDVGVVGMQPPAVVQADRAQPPVAVHLNVQYASTQQQPLIPRGANVPPQFRRRPNAAYVPPQFRYVPPQFRRGLPEVQAQRGNADS